MFNKYALDNPTLPVNLRFHHLFKILAECYAVLWECRAATTDRQTPDTILDPRCQSGPSARNSIDPSKGKLSKNYGADQQQEQNSDLHCDKFTTPATFFGTLGKILTQAYRGQVDYFVQEGVSVNQLSSAIFDGSGQLDGERMVDRSGQPDERNSSNVEGLYTTPHIYEQMTA